MQFQQYEIRNIVHISNAYVTSILKGIQILNNFHAVYNIIKRELYKNLISKIVNNIDVKKVKSSMAKSLPGENLLPQNVGSIINYLQ